MACDLRHRSLPSGTKSGRGTREGHEHSGVAGHYARNVTYAADRVGGSSSGDNNTRSSHPRRRRRRWLRVTLAVLAGLLLLTVVGGLWAVYSYGPRFGVYLTAPSPERYAGIALDIMDGGYYANGEEWDAARTRIESLAADAESYEELHAPLASALKAAGGDHSFFQTPAEVASDAEDATRGFTAPSVTTSSGVTTVTIPALGSVSAELQQEYALAAAEGIAAAGPKTCGWIIDVRGNTGGDMYPMLSGLSPLLPNGTAMTFQTQSGQQTPVSIYDDGAGIGTTAISVGQIDKVTGKPVAVLQDELTASSGEVVLTAFRGLQNVTSFGVPSAGYTSANAPHRLYDGAQIVLTGAVYVDRDGVNLNEDPIAPDQVTVAEQADETALEWLNNQGCD